MRGAYHRSPFSSRYAHQDYVDLLVKIISILAARWLMAEISYQSKTILRLLHHFAASILTLQIRGSLSQHVGGRWTYKKINHTVIKYISRTSVMQ